MRLNASLVVLLALAALLSLFVGRHWIAPGHWVGGDLESLIITELRLPRICVGMLVGAALGTAGASMQGYLRNPLADPGLFGVSACAALGAVASLFFGLGTSPWVLSVFALAGAGAGTAILSLVAGRSGSTIIFTLAGVMLSSLAAALTALIINLAPTPFASTEIVTWLMGALTDRSWDDIWLGLPLIAAGIAVLLTTRRSLDALTLGDLAARSMGVDMRRLQWRIVIGLALCVGSAVAIAGVIGFVGLMVPHIARGIAGPLHRQLLPTAALVGAALLTGSDLLSRLLLAPQELPVGIVTTSIGSVFVFLLLYRTARTMR